MPLPAKPVRIKRVAAFWALVGDEDDNGCKPWLGTHSRLGYGIFSHQKAHRIAWVLTNGDLRPDELVLHHCDVRDCVNMAHLYVGGQSDNMRDLSDRRRGGGHRYSAGGQHKLSRLSERDVHLIREQYASWVSSTALAERYGVHRGHINAITSGRKWVR